MLIDHLVHFTQFFMIILMIFDHFDPFGEPTTRKIVSGAIFSFRTFWDRSQISETDLSLLVPIPDFWYLSQIFGTDPATDLGTYLRFLKPISGIGLNFLRSVARLWYRYQSCFWPKIVKNNYFEVRKSYKIIFGENSKCCPIFLYRCGFHFNQTTFGQG